MENHAPKCPRHTDELAACLCADTVQPARASGSSPWGKCDDRMDVPMPVEMKEDLVAIARMQGKPAAEFARDVLCMAVVGEMTRMRGMLAQRQLDGDGNKVG